MMIYFELMKKGEILVEQEGQVKYALEFLYGKNVVDDDDFGGNDIEYWLMTISESHLSCLEGNERKLKKKLILLKDDYEMVNDEKYIKSVLDILYKVWKE